MPDRDYYVAEDARSKKLRDEYSVYMESMFKLVGCDQASANQAAAAVMNIETQLAKASRTRVQRRDPDKNYNKMSQRELATLAPAIEWKRFFFEAGWSDPVSNR